MLGTLVKCPGLKRYCYHLVVYNGAAGKGWQGVCGSQRCTEIRGIRPEKGHDPLMRMYKCRECGHEFWVALAVNLRLGQADEISTLR
jgi:hypothetical protein